MGSRILIVDDDEQLAKVVSTYLRMAGHEVKSVNDGSAAMDAIASFRPALVITDLMMPGLPGAELVAEAKVRRLYLYHHDPYQNDEAVAAKEAFGRQYFAERGLEIECLAAAEGHSISV